LGIGVFRIWGNALNKPLFVQLVEHSQNKIEVYASMLGEPGWPETIGH
jgi:L-alanine-DL-glutamate epimerase-like enolase superfamily enzyme